MHTFLGAVGLVVFVALTIVLAAAVTALVVRISPTPNKSPQQSGN